VADWQAARLWHYRGSLRSPKHQYWRDFRSQNDQVDAPLLGPWLTKGKLGKERNITLQAAESQAYSKILRLWNHREQRALHLLRICVQKYCNHVHWVRKYWRKERSHVHLASTASPHLLTQLECSSWRSQRSKRVGEPGWQRDKTVRHGQLSPFEAPSLKLRPYREHQ